MRIYILIQDELNLCLNLMDVTCGHFSMEFVTSGQWHYFTKLYCFSFLYGFDIK